MATIATRPRVSDNMVRGSCKNFKSAVERGALDKNGLPSGGTPAGFNRATISVKSRPARARKTVRGRWQCNQDGSLWDSREECFKNCRKRGLGGPIVVDCVGSEVVCLSTKVQFALDIDVEIYTLRWITNCAAGVRWNKQIRDHEDRHLKDITTRAKEWRQKNRSATFEACAPTEAEALAKLNEQIQAFIDSQTEAVDSQIKADADVYHETAGGNSLTVDCSECE